MKRQIEFKSALFGVMFSAILFTAFSFKKTNEEKTPRYQASSSERGFIILDTYTGDYILDSEVIYVGKQKWIKGDFKSSFKSGKDKTK